MEAHKPSEEEVSTFVKELSSAVGRVGVDGVLTAIRGLKESKHSSPREKKILTFIKKLTCKQFKVRLIDLKKTYIRGEESHARMVCIAMFRTHLEMKYKDIALQFNRPSHVFVSVALSEYNSLKTNIPHEQEILVKSALINEKIVEFIKNLGDASS
jgi:chromosomal replication initiation ATPase DnaA